MKAVYVSLLIVGAILLLATETENGASNLIGLIIVSCSAYKLELFDNGEEVKE